MRNCLNFSKIILILLINAILGKFEIIGSKFVYISFNMGNKYIQGKIFKFLIMIIRYLIFIILFNFVLYAQEVRILPLGDSITRG